MTTLLCILGGVLLAAAPAVRADAALEQFRDGDVVCFVGDSITHSRKFHGYIYDYYLTRFPERKIRFVNCGIAGDTAGGALQRLSWDVLPHQPTVISLMLGMNDVNRGLYGKTAPDEQNLRSREHALDSHRQNMAKIVEILQEKCHPRFIFCTPSPYDETAKIAMVNLFGVNEALGKCGEFAEELAAKVGGGVVDFHGPMTALNVECQKTDPTFTLIGSDRVHPLDVGQLVMAYLYLKAQHVSALVSRVALDVAGGKVVAAENAKVDGVQATATSVSFDCVERALPFPVDHDAMAALKLVPVVADLDQELLVVQSLRPGTYHLSIDGKPVGDFTAADLQTGVNLALNANTPQYQQAQKVLTVNEKRRQLEVRLRSVAQIRIMLDRAQIDPNDTAAMEKYFADFLEKQKAAGGQTAYFSSQFENYVKTKPLVAEIGSQIDQLTQQLWQINQPQSHHFELTPANG